MIPLMCAFASPCVPPSLGMWPMQTRVSPGQALREGYFVRIAMRVS
jgi:hypothetical protein